MRRAFNRLPVFTLFSQTAHRMASSHPAFLSNEYQNVMRQVREMSVPLCEQDSWEFVAMITDRNKWIDKQIKNGMGPDDALEKMRLLIRLRALDRKYDAKNAIDDFLDRSLRKK